MSYDEETEIYNKVHVINVLNKNEVCNERSLLIILTEYNVTLKIKIRDASDYNFNYTTCISPGVFEKMKQEQCLEITFQEFKPQLLDLLRSTELNRIIKSTEFLIGRFCASEPWLWLWLQLVSFYHIGRCLRFEVHDLKSRMVFYEKAKLKSLIFLVVELNITNQSEIIKEMGLNIQHLKEINCGLMTEISLLKRHINEKDEEIKIAATKHSHIQNKCFKYLQDVDQVLHKNLQSVQSVLQKRISALNGNLFRLTKDTEVLKEREYLRRNSFVRLNQTLNDLKLEQIRSHKAIEELQSKLQESNDAKAKTEQQLLDVKMEMARKCDVIQTMEEKIDELKKDMQNATLIIAQKSKSMDELARDLVQANQMIVNFNNHFDKMAAEGDSLREQLRLKDEIICEQKGVISKMREEYEDYRNKVKVEEILSLKEEVLKARKEIEGLEKQNRELSKLNAVLTRKVSGANMWTQSS